MAAIGIATAAVATFVLNTAQVGAQASPGVVIMFGDSFSSGEGGGWKGNAMNRSGDRSGTDMAAQNNFGNWYYYPQFRVYEERSWTDECHASRTSPIWYLKDALAGVTKVFNMACSGAKNKNIWPIANGGQNFKGRVPQLTELESKLAATDDVRMVVIGAGGNDSGFGDAVAECLGAFAHTYLRPWPFNNPQHCLDEVRDQIYPDVADVFYNQLKTIDLVRQRLEAKGQPSSSYRIVLLGYPSILPTATDDWQASEGSGLAWRCPIRKADAEWINTNYVKALNGFLKMAAEERGVGFIDLSDAFVGHRLCESGIVRDAGASASSVSAEWVRMLDVNDLSPWDIGEFLIDLVTWPISPDAADNFLEPQRHLSESFHPNYWGQQAVGTCLSIYATNTTGNPRMKCTNGPSRAADDMVLTTLPLTAKVTDDPSPNAQIPHPDCCIFPDPGDPEPEPIDIPNPLVRTITVPASVPKGLAFMPYLDIPHPKKGQLQIELVTPGGTVLRLRSYNPPDQGAFVPGRWTYLSHIDPSGVWTLKIYDKGYGGIGYLNKWDMKFF
jgi:hypothetical protein